MGGFSVQAHRDGVKASLLPMMRTSPRLVKHQLSDSLTIIARSDFPDNWPALLPDLVAELGVGVTGGAIDVVNGALETVASVFERFRNMEDTDENRGPLKKAIDEFAAPMLQVFNLLAAGAEKALADGAPSAALAPVLRALRTLCTIYYLLNNVDLPEFFEDHIKEWMENFHKFLSLRAPALLAAADDPEEGPLEALQAEVLTCVALYSEKYYDEFEPFQALLVQDAWQLVTTLSSEKLVAPNMDNLVPTAVKLLAQTIVKPSMSAQFAAEPLVRELLQRIVLPNIKLRDSDLELLDDNPVDFIRADLEGSDVGTRRRVAADLLAAVATAAPAHCSAVALELIGHALTEYDGNRAANEAKKDAAIALFMAVAIKSQTAAMGVTALNPAVSLGDFLRGQVFPELGGPVAERPLVKAACLKMVATFRAQFSRDELHALLPMLASLLASPNFVVHTYAAVAVDRFLCVKDPLPAAPAPAALPPVPQLGAGSSFLAAAAPPPRAFAPRVSVDALAPLVTPILSALFSQMLAPGCAENEYLMRTAMRVITFARERCGDAAPAALAALLELLGRVTRNPANPTFNHLLFEALASLLRTAVAPRPEVAAQFEAAILPHAATIIQGDVLEFQPYLYQVLAVYQDQRAAFAGTVRSMLPALLAPVQWQRRGGVPALASLVGAFLAQGGAAPLLADGMLLPLLNAWKGVLMLSLPGPDGKPQAMKGHEGYAFTVLDALFQHLPGDALAPPQLRPLLEVVLQAVETLKKRAAAARFVHSVGVLCGVHGPGSFVATMQGLSPGLLHQITNHVLAPMAGLVVGGAHRREAAVGLTRLLCEAAPAFFTDAAGGEAWKKLLAAAAELAESCAAGGGGGDAAGGAVSRSARLGGAAAFLEDEDLPEEAAEGPPAEYTASFNRLIHAQVPTAYAFSALPPPPAYFAQSVANLVRQAPQVGPLVQGAGGAVARLTAGGAQ